ncbi:unnamed protein product, partial [Laminaria digitata]
TKADSAQSRRQLKGKAQADGRPREPRLSSPTNQSPAGVAQPASARRRGLLSRPRGPQTVRDSTPVCAAETTRGQKGGDEHALDQIARVQLLHVLEAFGEGTARSGRRLGTSLFPKATPNDALNGDAPCDGCGRHGECSDACERVCGGGGNRYGRRVTGGGDRRVRPRPASWGTRASVERRGRLGIWPDGGDDDCWGDGDGHLTLRRFPPRDAVASAGAREAHGEGEFPSIIDAQPSSKEGKVLSSSSSRADRFLEVFSRLQPARRALNVEEPAPVSSSVPSRGGERVAESCAGLPKEPCADTPPSPSKPRGLLRGDSATATPAVDLSACKAGAVVGGHGAAGEMAVGGMDVSSSKRPTTLKAGASGSNSPDSERRTSGGTEVGDWRVPGVQETARTDHCATPSSKRSLPPEVARSLLPEPALEHKPRREPPAKHQRTQRQPAERLSEPPRVGAVCRVGAEARKLGATSKTPPLQVQTTSRVSGAPGLDPATGDACDAPAGKRQAPRIVETALKENSRPNPLPTAWDREGVKHPAVAPSANGPSSTHRSLSTTAVQRVSAAPTSRPLEDATARKTQPSPSRHRRPRNSEDVAGRVAGTTAADLRDSDSNASSAALGSTADLHGNRRSHGGSKLAVGCAGVASYQAMSAWKQSAVIRQVSSGLLTSACSRNERSGETKQMPFAPAACEIPEVPLGRPEVPVACETPPAACQGHEAAVAQKGSLTVVDPDHGATLRSSWSIDNSEELGNLDFGFSLDYDAVWYLSPADDECIGVLRYRVVPHPTLAPTGGWISERGRLRDDPYIIAKATPAPRPRPSHLATTVDPLSSSSNRRREKAERPAREIGVGGVRHSNSWQDASANTEQSRIEDENDGPRSSRGAAGSRHPPAASQHGHAVRPGASNENGQRRDHRRSHQKESGDRHPAGTAAGGSRRVQPASMSERGREDAPTRGNFGFLASPSAKVVEINDTGDKVKCPVCQRGMDHWKSGQRQQHVHGCLLKQPSSAMKPLPAADASVDAAHTAARSSGTTHRASVRDFAMEEGGSSFPTTPRDSPLPGQRLSATGAEKEPASSERGRRFPDPAGSPRPTRVSLQGVFSPKGVRARRDSALRGSTVGGKPAKTAMLATKGPSECPVCRLDFEGRQGQWERQAHIQQCLDSMESVFDSEE